MQKITSFPKTDFSGGLGGILVVLACPCLVLGCSGSARDLTKGSSLGPAVIGDDGSRNDGVDFGQIYTVTDIVPATSDISAWTAADLPFTGPRRQLGQTSFTDSQWPFEFNFSYPANNYKLNEAHVVLVTTRDSSDTEAIFVDGVFTGRPPANQLNASTTQVSHRHYFCSGCSGATVPSTPTNTYFMDWSLTHYKIGSPNSFDLNLADLLTPTAVTPADVVKDGLVRVVTGDDAAVADTTATTQSPLLFLEGFTISKTPLSCVDSPSYKFTNTYIHNDGNSIGQAAFAGTVLTPSASWSSSNSSFRSVEFYYDPRLPKVSEASRISLTKAQLNLQLKRAASGASALVINGVGIAEAGFDRTQATAAVEEWNDDATTVAAWASFLNGILANSTSQTKSLDLIALLGADKIRDLLVQGKLNVSVAGALATVYGQGATTGRTYGVAVNGPELALEGTYYTQICTVPDNPSSPLSDSAGAVGSCDLDQTSPLVSSVQVVNVTSTSATVQWLTNEPADSTVSYGISAAGTDTPTDAALTTFHSVQVTGLSPYKYYIYAVKTKDGCGNQTSSASKTFRTLR